MHTIPHVFPTVNSSLTQDHSPQCAGARREEITHRPGPYRPAQPPPDRSDPARAPSLPSTSTPAEHAHPMGMNLGMNCSRFTPKEAIVPDLPAASAQVVNLCRV